MRAADSKRWRAMDLGIFKAYDVRGLYGEQIDGDVAEQVGRAFARVLAGLRGKATSELRVGLGRDMRLTAPELAGRYRDGLVAEGAHVLDAGMVGTEMLYFLVGSRELDGGLMCTASHNPKAYTGAKLVREGALALSGDAGIGDMRDLCAAGLPARGRPARARRAGRRLRRLPASTCSASSTSGRSGRMKVVLDGGNGMAGPMVGPLLERIPGLELVTTFWEPDGEFPDHEPNPLLPENRRFVIDKVRSEGADLGIAWDGDADRCFFIDGGRRVRRRRLRLRAARPRRAGEAARARRSSTTCAPRGRCPTRCAPRAGPRSSTASATPSSSRACARRAAPSAARSPATTTSPTSTTPTPARCPRCSCSSCSAAPARRSPSCSSPTARATSSPARSTPRSPTRPGGSRRIRERYADATITELDGISVDYDDWHFNVRASNTEPFLRLCLESLVSREDMEARRDEVLRLIRS